MIMNGFNIGKQYGFLIVQTLRQHTQVRDFLRGSDPEEVYQHGALDLRRKNH